jgi:hypothetical protein
MRAEGWEGRARGCRQGEDFFNYFTKMTADVMLEVIERGEMDHMDDGEGAQQDGSFDSGGLSGRRSAGRRRTQGSFCPGLGSAGPLGQGRLDCRVERGGENSFDYFLPMTADVILGMVEREADEYDW